MIFSFSVGGWLNLPSFRIPVCQVSKDQVLCLNSICPLLILLLPISRFPEGRNRLTSLPTSLLHCRKEFPCANVSKSISRFPWRFPPSCKFKTIYQSSIRPTLLCCVHSNTFGLVFPITCARFQSKSHKVHRSQYFSHLYYVTLEDIQYLQAKAMSNILIQMMIYITNG